MGCDSVCPSRVNLSRRIMIRQDTAIHVVSTPIPLLTRREERGPRSVPPLQRGVSASAVASGLQVDACVECARAKRQRARPIESRAQGRTRKRTQRTGGRQRTSAVWPGGRDVFPVAEIIPVAKGATALSLPPVEKDLDVAVRKDDRQSRPPSSRAEKGREARQITQNP